MLLQADLTQRIIIILIIQVWPIFYGNYFAYKLLKRAKSRSTITLGSYFILLPLAYFLATTSVLFVNTPFSYLLYIIGIYFFVFSHCFLLLFCWVLVKLDDKAPYWKFHLIITFYGIISAYVFLIGFYFNGISLDASTNWLPNFSWVFLIISWVFLLIFLVIPQIYYSIKLLNVFEGVMLKRRINLFIISIFLELSVVFSLFLYNTLFDNQFYRTFHIIVIPVTSTLSAFLIYKSFGQELQ
jgi:hypothetical protein